MATWYKQGVYGELIPEAAEGLRKTEKLYGKEDIYVTSIRDGTHMPGSFHPHGRAWDQRQGSITKVEHKKKLGEHFDIVDYEGGHRHIEYDPKPF